MLGLIMATVLAAADAGAGLPAGPTGADCDDPAKRSAILGSQDANLAALDRAKAYNAEQEAALNARMDAIGMTKQERAELSLKVLKTPLFKAAFDQGTAVFRDSMANLEIVMTSKDATRNCKAIVRMTELVPAMVAAAEAQWAVFRAELDAEAAHRATRPGV